MAGVELHGVSKRWGDTTAVRDLTLAVDDGELMVLVGPSGCGKTTALRMVAGLDRPSQGSIHIGGRDVTDVAPAARDVAMVFQSYALYPHMTVRRNIESPLRSRKVHGAERDERVREAAASLGLDDLLDRKPAALSGGQRQRVALARALVTRPAVYLMDEPLSNLDAKLRAHTRVELVELHRRVGTTFLYVTHDQVEAMTMATRLAVLDAGSLQQLGTPREVYERPANLFVARFIGSPPMNTLAGEVADGGVVVAGARLPVAAATLAAAGVAAGDAVVVGARPEHVHVGGSLPARVTAIEWLGHEQHVVCDTPAGRVTARDLTGGLGPGDAVDLRLDDLHLFAPDGRRLA